MKKIISLFVLSVLFFGCSEKQGHVEKKIELLVDLLKDQEHIIREKMITMSDKMGRIEAKLDLINNRKEMERLCDRYLTLKGHAHSIVGVDYEVKVFPSYSVGYEDYQYLPSCQMHFQDLINKEDHWGLLDINQIKREIMDLEQNKKPDTNCSK